MLIDTASDISILNPKFYDKHSNAFKEINEPIQIFTVAKTPFHHYSIQNTTIHIGDISINLNLVLADIMEDCILGLDFLYKSGLLKNFEESLQEKFGLQQDKVVSVREIILQPSNQSYDKLPEVLSRLFEISKKLLNQTQQNKLKKLLIKFEKVSPKMKMI